MTAALTSPLPAASAGAFGWRRGWRRSAVAAPVSFWSLHGATPLPDGPVVVLVPGALVPLVPLDLPPALRGDARLRVAARDVRDRLGLGTQQVDLRPAPLGSEGGQWQTLLLARSEDLQAWRSATANLGRKLQAILPDYLALPTSPGLWTVQTGTAPDGVVQIRLGPGDGLSAEPELAALALQPALSDATAPRAVLRLGPAHPAIDAALARLQDQLPGLVIARDAADLPPDIAAPRVLAYGELALDLRQQQADPRMALRARIRALMLPALLFVLAGLVWAGGVLFETHQLEAELQARQDRNIALTRQYFLPDGPLPNIELQVARVIDERRAALMQDPGAELSALDVMWRASAAMAEADIDLQSMQLQGDMSVVVELTSPDFGILEALLSELESAGLAVALDRSASEGAGRVLGTLTLRAAAAAGDGP